jgi:hypothetical protein
LIVFRIPLANARGPEKRGTEKLIPSRDRQETVK